MQRIGGTSLVTPESPNAAGRAEGGASSWVWDASIGSRRSLPDRVATGRMTAVSYGPLSTGPHCRPLSYRKETHGC